MKTAEQILSFIQGWQYAICCDEKELNDENLVYQALLTLEQYIKNNKD